MRKKSSVMLLGLMGVIIAVSIYFFVYKNKGQILDISKYTQVYSNGWFEYSFKYPLGFKIVFEDTPPIFGSGVNVRNKNDSLICSVELFRKKPYHAEYIDQISPLKTNLAFTTNGLTWQKQRIESNNLLYGFKSTIWIAQTEEFMIKVLADKQSEEAFCEGMVVTLTTTTDQAVESAVSAQSAKQVALDYAKVNYPDKQYLEGWFVNDMEKPDRDALLGSDNAMVIFSNSIHPKFPEPKYLKLSKDTGNWKVIGVSDHRN